MATHRKLKGLLGNLYDRSSAAHHASLVTLLRCLIPLGFKGMKKKDNETTLRIYPVKYGSYPLLNPGFEASVPTIGRRTAKEVLVFWVLSKGSEELHRHLEGLPADGHCPFFVEDVEGVEPNPYLLHGRFVLPLTFLGGKGASEIDFGALTEPLQQLRSSLLFRSGAGQ